MYWKDLAASYQCSKHEVANKISPGWHLSQSSMLATDPGETRLRPWRAAKMRYETGSALVEAIYVVEQVTQPGNGRQ